LKTTATARKILQMRQDWTRNWIQYFKWNF